MTRHLLILATALAALLSSNARPAAADPVQALAGQRSLLVSHRGRLEQLLTAQVKQIGRLKLQPPGVRRDFQLRRALRENQRLADRLTQLQEQIRTLNRQLLAAYDRAIAQAKDSSARQALRLKRRQLAGEAGSAKSKIITREEAAELDSAEDLEEKADLLKDSEAKIRRQLARIQRQIVRLNRRARLRRHSRAADSSLFVEDSPRRLARARSRGSESTSAAPGRAAPAEPDEKTALDDASNPPPTADPSGAGGGDFYGAATESEGDASKTNLPVPPGVPAVSPSRSSSDGELNVTIRGVLDPSLLRELQQAHKSGNIEQRLAALAKAKRKLESTAEKLRGQAEKLRKRAKSRRTQK